MHPHPVSDAFAIIIWFANTALTHGAAACRQAQLDLSFTEEPLGVNGSFIVCAQLTPPVKQAPAAEDGTPTAPEQPLFTASGIGQSKQKGRQHACAALLEVMLEVGDTGRLLLLCIATLYLALARMCSRKPVVVRQVGLLPDAKCSVDTYLAPPQSLLVLVQQCCRSTHVLTELCIHVTVWEGAACELS
jgi:hypothetical protein